MAVCKCPMAPPAHAGPPRGARSRDAQRFAFVETAHTQGKCTHAHQRARAPGGWASTSSFRSTCEMHTPHGRAPYGK